MSDQEAPQPSNDERSQGAKQQDAGRGRSRHRHRQPGQSQQPQRRTERSLNMDELRELVQLFTENSLTEFELEREDLRIRLGRNAASESSTQASHATTTTPASSHPTQTPGQASASAHSGVMQPTGTPHPGAQAEAAASEDEDLYIITCPILGTFYRSPSPTAEPFVRIGSQVELQTTVCIIEAMKLMNEIQAEVHGEVVKIYVENGQPVEYGQPLFGIKKA